MRPVPGLRERKKALTRRAISDVATRLFIERGFDAVTLADVAEAAQVSVKTILNHFGSKEDLFLDRQDQFREELCRTIAERPAGVRPTEALAGMLSEHRIPDGQGWAGLYDPAVYAVFQRFLRAWHASPALLARRSSWGHRLQLDLAAQLAAEHGLAPDDETVRVMAAMIASAVTLRFAALAEWVLDGRPAADVEAGVRAIVAEAMLRVGRAFPELDLPRAATAVVAVSDPASSAAG
ncbi:MAG: helix-turn-helix domain-containing protein [Thermoleophilia bacterium]